MTQQGGMSASAMVLVLLFLSLMVIMGTAAILLSVRKDIVDETYYYRHYHLAASGLSWGLLQTWQPSDDVWRCQNMAYFSVCIRRFSRDELTLLRSKSGTMSVYGLTEYDENTHTLRIQKGKWLDYCPEKSVRDCE